MPAHQKFSRPRSSPLRKISLGIILEKNWVWLRSVHRPWKAGESSFTNAICQQRERRKQGKEEKKETRNYLCSASQDGGESYGAKFASSSGSGHIRCRDPGHLLCSLGALPTSVESKAKSVRRRPLPASHAVRAKFHISSSHALSKKLPSNSCVVKCHGSISSSRH